MTTISAYRARLDALLASAVDPATWPEALKDEALRRALDDYGATQVYESSLTLASDGYEQDVSGLADLDEVLALAWPWREGGEFDRLAVRWRTVGDHLLYLETRARPRAGDLLRVRHTRRHTIDGLDGATETTVPPRHRAWVTLAAGLWALDLRVRQMSENPALPPDAARTLQALRADLHARYEAAARRIQASRPVVWRADRMTG